MDNEQAADGDEPQARDHDVVVVGGGPAGCAAAIFTAREGLDTVIFDRGRSSLKRCAHLENYPGFPAGIDIETLYDLLHDHAESAGCTVVPDMVESVDTANGHEGFAVELQDGDSVSARRVVAATRYSGEYLRGLDEDEAMFRIDEHDGEIHESFDRNYGDRDGTTPVDGLYVASPADPADKQALLAAACGARAGRRVVADARIDDGWWEAAATGVDWMRRESALDEEWSGRARWVAWFDEHHADAPVDADSERFERVREASIDASLETYLTEDEIARRKREGQQRLASHLDPEAVVAAHNESALLDAMDEETIRAALSEPPTQNVEAEE